MSAYVTMYQLPQSFVKNSEKNIIRNETDIYSLKMEQIKELFAAHVEINRL